MNQLPDWMYHAIEESFTCRFASTTAHDIPVAMPVFLNHFDPASVEQVSLTLLHYDEQMKGERYLLFYGHLTETGNEWTFTPSHVVLPRWGRRA